MNDYDRMSFSQLHENEYKAYAAVEAMQKISALSIENGLDNISLEEINAEIEAARAERAEQSE